MHEAVPFQAAESKQWSRQSKARLRRKKRRERLWPGEAQQRDKHEGPAESLQADFHAVQSGAGQRALEGLQHRVRRNQGADERLRPADESNAARSNELGDRRGNEKGFGGGDRRVGDEEAAGGQLRHPEEPRRQHQEVPHRHDAGGAADQQELRLHPAQEEDVDPGEQPAQDHDGAAGQPQEQHADLLLPAQQEKLVFEGQGRRLRLPRQAAVRESRDQEQEQRLVEEEVLGPAVHGELGEELLVAAERFPERQEAAHDGRGEEAAEGRGEGEAAPEAGVEEAHHGQVQRQRQADHQDRAQVPHSELEPGPASAEELGQRREWGGEQQEREAVQARVRLTMRVHVKSVSRRKYLIRKHSRVCVESLKRALLQGQIEVLTWRR